MGLTHVTASQGNLSGDKPVYEGEFLVETGSIDCLAPRSALNEAGIKVEGNAVYELANGVVIELAHGVFRLHLRSLPCRAGPDWNCNPRAMFSPPGNNAPPTIDLLTPP